MIHPSPQGRIVGAEVATSLSLPFLLKLISFLCLQQGGGGFDAVVRRPGARFRILLVRPGARQIYGAAADTAGAREGTGGARGARGGQRRRRGQTRL